MFNLVDRCEIAIRGVNVDEGGWVLQGHVRLCERDLPALKILASINCFSLALVNPSLDQLQATFVGYLAIPDDVGSLPTKAFPGLSPSAATCVSSPKVARSFPPCLLSRL